MRHIIEDKKYSFRTAFDTDTDTGAYVRTGILDENGADTGVDPFMASYPHLIDVGIMGHCVHGKTGLCAKAGIGCYQSGMLVEQPNMTVEDFRTIAEQSRGKCNQFALGGRGDPDQHEYFEEILQICRENVLVPNFTTSGYGMTPEIAALCLVRRIFVILHKSNCVFFTNFSFSSVMYHWRDSKYLQLLTKYCIIEIPQYGKLTFWRISYENQDRLCDQFEQQ